MDWVKAITELIKALAHFAWPVLVGLIVWWFRKEIRREIAALIARIWKFKALGVEVETKEEFKLSLENVKVGIGEDKIQEVKVALEKAKAKILEEKIPEMEKQSETLILDWRALPTLIDGGSRQTAFLSALANADPRAAIKQSWELLAKAVLRAAKVEGENLGPHSAEISRALKRLETDTRLPEGLVLSIKNLQDIARKVFLHSQWAPAI